MNSVVKSYKIRIYPSKKQQWIINMTMGACRWIYNDYLAVNQRIYKETGKGITGYEYSKLLTVWKKEDPRYIWLNKISSKAIHEAFMDADEALRRFFRNKDSRYPRFKSKYSNPVTGYFFVGDKVKFKHNYVNLPILKWTKISENTYVPKDHQVIGGTIKKDSRGKYWAVFRIEYPYEEIQCLNHEKPSKGIGIDLGIKSFVVASDKEGNFVDYPPFYNHKKIKEARERIVYLQRIISKKMEINYWRLLNYWMDKHPGEEPSDTIKNKLKGKSYSNSCRRIQKKINRIKDYITNFKKDKIHKIVLRIVENRPKFITVEDFRVSKLVQSKDTTHDFHKKLQDSMFRYFLTKLEEKCTVYGIELRRADRFFASTKKCSNCGHKKSHISLNERTYFCEKCGYEIDRDLNAAINLAKTRKYNTIVLYGGVTHPI